MSGGDPALSRELRARLRLPVMAGPMFIASTPALVVAQCKAGIVGAMPALNARSTEALDEAIQFIRDGLDADDPPFAINLVAHRSNDRLGADLAMLVRHRVPIVIVSLAAPAEIVAAVRGYGGYVFNDVISERHAVKCAAAGADGLIAVCAGAGGHTGNVSPFALVEEIRAWWAGPLALAGCIATGRGVLAAEAMGADFAYVGSPFLASAEARTSDAFKAMVVASASKDVVVTNGFTGVDATFLKPSLAAHGLDPAGLARPEGLAISIRDGGADARAWRDIWSAGQGIGAVKRAEPAGDFIAALAADYDAARAAWGLPVQATPRPSDDQ